MCLPCVGGDRRPLGRPPVPFRFPLNQRGSSVTYERCAVFPINFRVAPPSLVFSGAPLKEFHFLERWQPSSRHPAIWTSSTGEPSVGCRTRWGVGATVAGANATKICCCCPLLLKGILNYANTSLKPDRSLHPYDTKQMSRANSPLTPGFNRVPCFQQLTPNIQHISRWTDSSRAPASLGSPPPGSSTPLPRGSNPATERGRRSVPRRFLGGGSRPGLGWAPVMMRPGTCGSWGGGGRRAATCMSAW